MISLTNQKSQSGHAVGWILFALVVMILGVIGWTWMTLHVSYASGERAGYVQKISQKGWICKTWEGELAMMNLPGSMPQVFSFTVRDQVVAHQIEQMAGQRVALHYDQHRGVPSACFGETEYFVTAVSPMQDLPGISAPPSSPAGVVSSSGTARI